MSSRRAAANTQQCWVYSNSLCCSPYTKTRGFALTRLPSKQDPLHSGYLYRWRGQTTSACRPVSGAVRFFATCSHASNRRYSQHSHHCQENGGQVFHSSWMASWAKPCSYPFGLSGKIHPSWSFFGHHQSQWQLHILVPRILLRSNTENQRNRWYLHKDAWSCRQRQIGIADFG